MALKLSMPVPEIQEYRVIQSRNILEVADTSWEKVMIRRNLSAETKKPKKHDQ